MADRYPLVYNPSANQLQELQSGDSLDVGGTTIKNAVGYSTAGGTSSQFLKADGSIDSNTYLTSAGTVALAEGITGSPSINVSAVSGTNGTFSGNVSAVNVSASSSVTAATFYGDGQNLTNTGSTLSASSGTQRVVLTGQTSGTMTASATDSDLTYDSSTNTLNVLNLNVQGTTTTIDTAITAVDSLEVEGSVGIGTDNPTESKIVIGHTQTSTVKHLAIKDLTNNWVRKLGVDSSNNFGIFSGDIEHLRITSDGILKVGSGANSATQRAELLGGYTAFENSAGNGNPSITFNNDIDTGFLNPSANTLVFNTAGSERIRITDTGNVGINSTAPAGALDVGGNVFPAADNTHDLGSASKRWANIYTGDLNLSNEGSSNDVDGTWGQYTIQEGEDDLFLINRRTGKKYKFNLTEVN